MREQRSKQVQLTLLEKREHYCRLLFFLCSWTFVILSGVEVCINMINYYSFPEEQDDESKHVGWIVYVVGVALFTLCNVVEVSADRLNVIYMLAMVVVCLVPFMAEDYWDFSSYCRQSFYGCLLLGCLQPDLRKVLVGNSAAYAIRLGASQFFIAEPKAMMSPRELANFQMANVATELTDIVLLTAFHYLLELAAVALVESQLVCKDATVELESVRAVLDELSDGVVYLDQDLRVRGNSAKFAQTLMPNPGVGASLQKENFFDYVAEEDRQVLSNYISSRSEGFGTNQVADPICINLLDCHAMRFAVQVFHALVFNSQLGQWHLLAVQHLGEQGGQEYHNYASQKVADSAGDNVEIRSNVSVSTESSSESTDSAVKADVASLSLDVDLIGSDFKLVGFRVGFGAETVRDDANTTAWPSLFRYIAVSERLSFHDWLCRAIPRATYSSTQEQQEIHDGTVHLPILGKVRSRKISCSLPHGMQDDDDVPIHVRVHFGDPQVDAKTKRMLKKGHQLGDPRRPRSGSRRSAGGGTKGTPSPSTYENTSAEAGLGGRSHTDASIPPSSPSTHGNGSSYSL
eukprot:TRINITY_DN18515_c0_g1_i3.p1 TRINITY_DN18515_c0_g1~~TRINITY_DN18515_c0_g1_i3.p1  ORF type:complete len:650 (+),score=79.07 TRINITY_DN18515_c0_g1_i3:229-1950(+)